MLFLRFVIFGFALVVSTQTYSANLIYMQDFEMPNLRLSDVFYTDNSPPDGYVAIVSNNPHSGSKCIRGNVYVGALDPITGLPGSLGPYLNIGGTSGNPTWGTNHNFRDYHTNELYVSYWMRWDNGANFQRNLGFGIEGGAYKMFYISSTGNINYTYNNRYKDSCSYYQNTGIGETYVGACSDNINDGTWHHYEAYFRYETPYGAGDGVWRLWEDGVLKWERTNVTFLTAVGGKFTSLRFIHYTGGALASSGWQLDDIEIWDGMPNSSSPLTPNPPFALSIH